MRRPRISLFNFIVVSLCATLLIVSLYERRRANEIESKSLVVSTPEYRAVLEQDWDVLRRQIQHQEAIRQFKNTYGDLPPVNDEIPLSIGARRSLANIRNSDLRISREKLKLESMRNSLAEQIVRSFDKDGMQAPSALLK